MRKKIDFELTTLLLELDFFFNSFNKKDLTLNYQNIIKEIKQIIRVLNFLKKHEKQVSIKVLDAPKKVLNILSIFLKNTESIFLKNSGGVLKYNKKINIAMLLNKTFTNKNFTTAFINNKIRIFLQFNFFLKTRDFGSYKVSSNFDHWKKILFLALLIKKLKL